MASLRRLSALTALLLSPLAWGHDGDPKVLDLAPAYVGPGYTPGRYLPSGSAPPSAVTTSSSFTGIGTGSIEFPRNGVQLLSWLPVGELWPGSARASDCWGYTSLSGREYAVVGVTDGTVFVEITDPSDPVVVANIAGPASVWRDMKVFETWVYAVSEGGDGIQVIDVSQIDSGVVTHTGTVLSGGLAATHNVAINEDSGYLYRCGGSGKGIRVYDLNANPANPQYVGQWSSRYVHDAQVVSYTTGPYAGREIAFLCAGFNNGWTQTGVTVLDVTNKGNMFVRDHFQYSNPHYSHQAWLSPDKKYLYVDDEADEGPGPTTTYVLDVTDLDNLSEAAVFDNGNDAIGHNLYTSGDLILEANYRSGLRVFDASDALSVTEIAYFDTWPEDDAAHYNGLWSCFPYFPSGCVIGSDVEKGLFVWWVGDALLEFDFPGGIPAILDPGGDSVVVEIAELNAGDLEPGSGRLYADAGAGLVEVPLVPLGNSQFRADFPATVCGTEVRWFVGARSTSGALWTHPAEAPYTSHLSTAALAETVVFADDMEADLGWVVGAPTDDAVAGIWVLGDPVGTDAQPENDHTPNGTDCWYTGAASHVTSGTTTVNMPFLDLSTTVDPVLSFWLFVGRGASTNLADHVRVAASTDGGQTWQVMLNVHSMPNEEAGAWKLYRIHLREHVDLAAETRIRFRAVENNLPSVFEVALDDVRVVDADCGCGANSYCTTSPNSVGPGAVIDWSGTTGIGANDLVLGATGGPAGEFGLFYYGESQAQVLVGDGVLCVGGVLFRLAPSQSDASGTWTHALDLATPPHPMGQVSSGETWNFQLWYRDPSFQGAGFNFSDALSVSFCP